MPSISNAPVSLPAFPAASPGLLVSVRNLTEAKVAAEAGVAIIDLKEPFDGPLAAVAPAVLDEIGAWIRSLPEGDSPFPLPVWSMACGELRDWILNPERSPLEPERRRHPAFSFVKFGLAGCSRIHDWETALDRVWKQGFPDAGRVAVAYADWAKAGAPRPDAVLAAAVRLQCAVLLVDTFDKSCGNLMQFADAAGLGMLVEQAHAAGMQVALAGSLRLADIPAVCSFGPDLVAVRSAACEGGRTGTVSGARIAVLQTALQQGFPRHSRGPDGRESYPRGSRDVCCE